MDASNKTETQGKQCLNPYLPSYEYVPDGEPHKFGDRIYLFGSHDRFNGKTFCMNDYVCWSAPETDLSDWRYEGVIWKRSDDPHWRRGQYLYAPDVCCGADGRFYLYYGFSTGLTRKSWAIRVAVATKPTGPYRYYGEVDLYQWSREFLPFDPAVYVEDGRIWLYYGSGMFYPMPGVSRRTIRGGAVVELAPDMLTVISAPKQTVPLYGKEYGKHGFFEASSVRKIGDLYYFIYSSMLGHELCYATSDRPDGKWTFGGTIVSIGNIGLDDHVDAKTATSDVGNTHGSIAEADGQYYIFYHRHTNRHCFSRQGCAERIRIGENGKIEQVETTSCGLNGKPLVGRGSYEARIACELRGPKDCRFYGGLCKKRKGQYPYFTQEGKDREEAGDQYIANMHNGSVAVFRYFDCRGVRALTVETRGNGAGKMCVSLVRGGAPVAEIAVIPGRDWHEQSVEVSVPDGVHALYFTFTGTGRIDFNRFAFE